MPTIKLGAFRRFFFDAPKTSAASLEEMLDTFRFKPIDPADLEVTRSLGAAPVATTLDRGGLLADTFGQYIAFGVRIDTLKIPAGTLKHHLDVACEALKAELHVDVLTRYQVAEAKETVTAELRRKLPPQVKHFPVLLDPDSGIAYVFATSAAVLDELLEAVLGVAVVPEGCYTRARRLDFLGVDVDRVPELAPLDLSALLAGDVDGGPAHRDEVLRAAGGGLDLLDRIARSEHLGAEFLLWLWWRSDAQSGVFECDDEAFELWFDDKLTLSSSAVNAQEDAFSGGHPVSSAEARAALRLGKLPYLAKVRLVKDSQEWGFVVKAGELALDAMKLPGVLSHDTDEYVCERLGLIERAEETVDFLFGLFLAARMGAEWPEALVQIKAWVENPG